MRRLQIDPGEDIQSAGRMARGLSLLVAASLLILLAFNEDFRNTPTLPAVVLCVLALSTLFAWQWETAGGLVTLLLSPVFLLSLIFQWSEKAELSQAIWELALIGICLVLPFLIIGLLFVLVGRQRP
ncbi:MAG: hypothetical protein PVJ75_11350 [Chloroflexota bacterium]|jgi:hypothetical protein